MANLSLTFKFICIFSAFVFICLVLYTNNKPFVKFSFSCSALTYDEMINSRLSVDQNGGISPSDLNGNLLSSEHNKCLRVNNSASGINRFMHKDAFVDVNCSVVNKRLLKNNNFKKTALASIPGSGNTWARHLIEEMTDFEKKLKSKVDKWVKFNEEWMLSFPGPVFVLFYDKLKSDLPASLAKLALFLGVNTTLKDLWCVTLRQEGSFHRPLNPEWMSRSNLLNDDLEKLITEAKKKIYDICTEHDHKDKITSNL